LLQISAIGCCFIFINRSKKALQTRINVVKLTYNKKKELQGSTQLSALKMKIQVIMPSIWEIGRYYFFSFAPNFSKIVIKPQRMPAIQNKSCKVFINITYPIRADLKVAPFL